jgi:hypothetical protein
LQTNAYAISFIFFSTSIDTSRGGIKTILSGKSSALIATCL